MVSCFAYGPGTISRYKSKVSHEPDMPYLSRCWWVGWLVFQAGADKGAQNMRKILTTTPNKTEHVLQAYNPYQTHHLGLEIPSLAVILSLRVIYGRV